MTRCALTRDELLALPSVVDVETAARALGIGRDKAYGLISQDEFPVAPIRLGRLIKIPTEGLRRVLGFDPAAQPDLDGPAPAPTAGPPTEPGEFRETMRGRPSATVTTAMRPASAGPPETT
jgi:predicted DNA-binding transcriptional regulator AlpA